MTQRDAERRTERVAVLMTATEKFAHADRASTLSLSLVQFCREAGASYVIRSSQRDVEAALGVALNQLDLTRRRAEQIHDHVLGEVRAALRA